MLQKCSIGARRRYTLRNFKMIRMDTIPCWYELSWREEKDIILRVHSDFANATKQVPANAPIVTHFKNNFGFAEFSGEFGKNFGFEDSLLFLGEKERFQEYFVPTPLVRKDTGKKCRYCKGSGVSDLFEDVCSYCNGEGKEIRYYYAEAYAVSASLSLLFELMRFPEITTTCPFPQLMTVQTVTIRGPHGGTVGGEYSREALDWMKIKGEGNIPEMISAMRTVWEKMDGRMMSFYEHSFRAYLDNNQGWLCTDLPGDACGIHPDHGAEYETRSGRGFEFSSHNVDTPQQQLTIIASLAALHDLMRRGV